MKSGAKVFSATWLIFALNFASEIAMANFLGLVGKGEVAVFISSLALAVVVSQFGLGAAAVYWGEKSKFAQRQVLVGSAGIILALSLVVELVAIAAFNWLNHSLDSHIFIIACLGFPWVALYQFAGVLLLGRQKPNEYAMVSLLASCTFLGLMLLAEFTPGMDLTPWKTCVLFAISRGIPALLALWFLFKGSEKASVVPSKELIISLFRFGAGQYPGALGGLALKRMDTIAIGLWVGPGAAGLYSIGKYAFEGVMSVPRSIAAMLAGASTRLEDAGRAAALVVRSAKVTFVVMTLFALAGSVAAIWLVVPIFGAEFADAVQLIWVMALAGVLLGTASVFNAYFFSIGRPWLSSILTVLSGIVSVIGLLLTVPPWGETGAAYSLLFASLIALVGGIRVMLKTSDQTLHDLFRTK